MKFRGHNQNTVRASGLQTAATSSASATSSRRVPEYGTNGDATGFAHRVHILLRDPDQLLIVNLIIRSDIRKTRSATPWRNNSKARRDDVASPPLISR